MAFRIDGDACTSCGSCIPECAVEAISESTDYYVIDEDTCIDCGACVDVCAFDAISEI
ncbi:MAG: 4Fe-4S binding protein [Bacillota bacterium]|nr:4Fe-4S binding protein [Bacillota bacterium]HHU60712.1 4Fe-4S binding protein [Natronincola sp.]